MPVLGKISRVAESDVRIVDQGVMHDHEQHHASRSAAPGRPPGRTVHG
jgi:hypothetical protein